MKDKFVTPAQVMARYGAPSVAVTFYGVFPADPVDDKPPTEYVPQLPTIERTFRCAKCTAHDPHIQFNKEKNVLNCRCRRCDHTWEEQPSDAK